MSKRAAILLALTVVAILIKIFSLFPEAVEKYYSNGLYPIISKAQRYILGSIPFSIGDLIYGLVAIYLVYQVISFGWKVSRKLSTKKYLADALLNTAIFALTVYVWFNLSWGLNYNRKSITHQLALNASQYKPEDLKEVMAQLVVRLNSLHLPASANREKIGSKKFLFDNAVRAYDSLSQQHNNFKVSFSPRDDVLNELQLFRYQFPAVKPSIYSYLGNYLGFTGYYNPFTGEAQVNTTVPLFVRPFTTCHEIGHQLGYAKENEANLAAYLSARSSNDPSFLYSVYFEMYSYSRRYMYAIDSMELKRLDSSLSEGVKTDYRLLRKFLADHANPVEVVIDKLYSRYLQANEQPAGRVTYNEVVLLLVAYWKKYGEV